MLARARGRMGVCTALEVEVTEWLEVDIDRFHAWHETDTVLTDPIRRLLAAACERQMYSS